MDLLTANVPTRAQSMPPRGTFTHTLSRLTRSTVYRHRASRNVLNDANESVGEEKKRLCAQAAAPRFSL